MRGLARVFFSTVNQISLPNVCRAAGTFPLQTCVRVRRSSRVGSPGASPGGQNQPCRGKRRPGRSRGTVGSSDANVSAR